MSVVGQKSIEAKPHTPVYRMHKYFARRPWNVFSSLINQYSSEGDIVLDPFCGGGVTVVESLKLRRKVIGVDSNPVATYVTSMECIPATLQELDASLSELQENLKDEMSSLYTTRCGKCESVAVTDWFEWDEKTRRILRVKLDCPRCGSIEKSPDRRDEILAAKIEKGWKKSVEERRLWFPPTKIPRGDKTDSLLTRGITGFNQLFTPRNLLALAILRKEILNVKNPSARELLLFTFSSSLKWASRQSHVRGPIVEGWAMHAYWIYPKSLEINVWNVFKRRYYAISRGKEYSNEHIGTYCKFTNNFVELASGNATCLLLNRDAAQLPIPDNSVDAVITDPPYGGNVNYAELSDFWYVWMSHGKLMVKESEIVINRTQEKSIDEYGKLLELVFRECYRVLKQGRYLVSTFNSKDFRVVTRFILAASTAGFMLSEDGAKYQEPIRPYTTTFHAMQIGAFVGDFIFTFRKNLQRSTAVFDENQMQTVKTELSRIVDESVNAGRPEPNLREQAYRLLIPFLSKHAVTNPNECRATADFFEQKVRENDSHLKVTRKRITEERKRNFRAR